MLIASALSLCLIGICIIMYMMLQVSWQETNAVLEIERKASLAMERLLRGFNADSDLAPRGLLDAKSFVIDEPGRIRFTSGIDSVERSFYFDDGRLMYDPNTSIGTNEILLTEGISILTFSVPSGGPAKLVLINIMVSKQVRGVAKNINLWGAASLRNG